MPRGPNGERRPADVIGCAVRVAKTATGEVKEDLGKVPGRRKSGKAGAHARAASLTAAQRSAIAKMEVGAGYVYDREVVGAVRDQEDHDHVHRA